MDRRIVTKDGIEYYGTDANFADEHDYVRFRGSDGVEERIYKSNIARDLSAQSKSSGGCLVLLVFSAGGVLAFVSSIIGFYYYI